jgi:hypothetical protein
MTTIHDRSRQKSKPAFAALHYSPKPASRSTVRSQYARWRQLRGLPMRCDLSSCVFNVEPLLWQGKTLPVILDHTNGNRLDNSPKNLRYLCPNCDAQLATRGGKNRGRVIEASEGTYVLAGANGSQNRVIVVNTAVAVAAGITANVSTNSCARTDDA